MKRLLVFVAFGFFALPAWSQGFLATVNVDADIGQVYAPDAFLAGDEVIFLYRYDSRGNWDCSLFNPPDGNAFMIVAQSRMQPGKGSMIYAIPASTLDGITEITSLLDFKSLRGTVFFKLESGTGGLRRAEIPQELVAQVVRPRAIRETEELPTAEQATTEPRIATRSVEEKPALLPIPEGERDARLLGRWVGVSWPNDWTFLADGTGVYHQSGITEPFFWATEGNRTLLLPSMASKVEGRKNFPTYRFANGHLFLRKFNGVKKIWFEDEYVPAKATN